MTPLYCQECGRANGASARRCIWCGVPLVEHGHLDEFASTRVEIDYLDGIERLDNPAPVRMVIGREGIEVSETLPGSRSFTIPANSIVEVRVVDRSTVIERASDSAPWWRRLMTRKPAPESTKHDYILSISYKEGTEIVTAVFRREDAAGLPVVEGAARIVNALMRLGKESSGH